ncbi:hypothetical protein EAE96_005178 [Botrytis aclada]|nr:hypothetical protein EAE96_005178 [Botrytis aclada]
MTNENGVFESGMNSAIDEYTLNDHIIVGSQDNPASDIYGAQSSPRLFNSQGTIFENDDTSVYESMSFGIDKVQSSRIEQPHFEGHRIQEATLNGFQDVCDDDDWVVHLTNLNELDTPVDNSRCYQQLTEQRADDQDQGFRNGPDIPSVHSMSAFESTEDDDCEFEMVSPEETERLWGIIPESRSGNNVSSQIQTTLPFSNELQPLILSDNNNSNHYTSNGDLRRSFYDTWEGTIFDDRMADLSGSNQDDIFRSGRLATETSTGLEQLCSQYGVPEVAHQGLESIMPPQLPQIQTQSTDFRQSDGNWTSASRRIPSDDHLNPDRYAEHNMNFQQQTIQYFNFNSGGYESVSQNETRVDQVPVLQERSQESHRQENHGPNSRKRNQTRGAKTTKVQAGGINVAGGLSNLEGKSERDEINRGSHKHTKRNKSGTIRGVSQPRLEQRSYCMSRVSVSLDEMRAIDPDYDKHPHRAFQPERMKFSRQTGMKTIVMPARMIDLLNAHRQKAREEERINPTGRTIPRDFKLRPIKHKDFEAFQAARKNEEETRFYENLQKVSENYRSLKVVRNEN